MPEIRIIEHVEDGKGNVIEEITAEISDERLAIEQVAKETDTANDQALIAYQNYASLTLAQKDKILKVLLGDYIRRHPEKYGG